MQDPLNENNLRPLKCAIFTLSILLYALYGLHHQVEFPWFIGDAFGIITPDMEHYDAFGMLEMFGWLIVFVANAYFIYMDCGLSLWYAIIYIISYYQFIICMSLEDYYQNVDYLFIKHVDYLSAVIILALNAYILSVNKYILPKSNEYFNAFAIHSFIFLYLFCFGYETVFGTLLYKRKFATKCFALFLFFGSEILFILFITYGAEEQDKIDFGGYDMRMDARNQAIMDYPYEGSGDSDQTDEEEEEEEEDHHDHNVQVALV